MMTLIRRRKASTSAPDHSTDGPAAGCIPIADVKWRQHVRFVGRVRSLRVQPWSDVATLECTLVDDSGGVTVVFLGRRAVPGLHLGSRMIVEGTAGAHHGKLAVLNPEYTLLANG